MAAVSVAMPAMAQPLNPQTAPQQVEPQLRSPILTLDTERLYAESLFGQDVRIEYDRQGEALAAQNRQIEADLTAEEQSLTEARAAMEPTDFRAAADAFDAKVQQIRIEQDAKQEDLQDILTRGREQFLVLVTQDLIGLMAETGAAGVMAETGAAVILDRRSVFLSAGVVDVTDEAIERVNDGYRARRDAAQGANAPASGN
ncbi:outer membrane chaperone Skp [Ketogulonicigenium vulgare Y25]|uniref:OmpH family outer membrane protein n=1 Tax=Ketogulonicigenium vulgare TaxID=92945 RepID=UPI0001E679AF|nr:OmpH family outer membrane protein [Ketogulonicigenium vulgare]ADO42689.1 outer membrane chaperone Skp [Ketogulonicigenium vulgare Y25]